MGNNKPIDKAIVQKVFEMRAAGDSTFKIGSFFHHSGRWTRHILSTYSPEAFSPFVVRKRGKKRKTTKEEDELIVRFRIKSQLIF